MEFKSNWLGKCPFCDSDGLMYGNVQFENNCIYFPWECSNCGNTGREWSSLEFIGHDVYVDGKLHILEDIFIGGNNENE